MSPSVPNYLYSNPVKVLKYLKNTYGNGLTLRSSNANIISRKYSTPTIKREDEHFQDKKRFSVGNLDEMMSLSMRPTNFQTYLAMKKYSQADISALE